MTHLKEEGVGELLRKVRPQESHRSTRKREKKKGRRRKQRGKKNVQVDPRLIWKLEQELKPSRA